MVSATHMTPEDIAEILARPYARQLLNGRTAEVGLIAGIPDGYLTAGHKVMTDDQYPEWVAGVQAIYDEMATITITPTWAKLLDFETTIPQAVDDLIKQKSAG